MPLAVACGSDCWLWAGLAGLFLMGVSLCLKMSRSRPTQPGPAASRTASRGLTPLALGWLLAQEMPDVRQVCGEPHHFTPGDLGHVTLPSLIVLPCQG